MAAPQIFYDRVEIYLDGQQYLPDGHIQNFRASMRTNSKLVGGMTQTGIEPGVIIGNSQIDVTWTEILPSESLYININTFLQANPNSELTVVPFSLATNSQPAPNFPVSGLVLTNQEIDVAGGSSEAMRRNTFVATTCGGLNI